MKELQLEEGKRGVEEKQKQEKETEPSCKRRAGRRQKELLALFTLASSPSIKIQTFIMFSGIVIHMRNMYLPVKHTHHVD